MNTNEHSTHVRRFDRLVLTQVESVRRVGLSTLRDREHLDDFIQEVILRAYVYRDQLREPGRAAQWLSVIAKNTARMWNRRRDALPVDEILDLPTEGPSPDDQLVAGERWSALSDALERLNEEDATLIRLRYMEEQSFESLQQFFGVSYAAIRKRLSRAQQLLRQQFAALGMSLSVLYPDAPPRRFGELRKGSNRMAATASITASLLIAGGLVFSALADRETSAEWATEPDGEMFVTLASAPQPDAASRLAARQPSRAAFVQAAPAAPNDGKWGHATNLRAGRTLPASAALDGVIYTVGGYTAGGGGRGIKTVESYDPTTNTWSELAEMPSPRGGLGVAVVRGKLYAIGGATGLGDGFTGVVEMYDPTTDTWSPKADMPSPRHGMGVAVVGDSIYCFGGVNDVNNNDAGTAAEVYDPQRDVWREVASLPVGRQWGPAVGLDGLCYLVGGGWAGGAYETVLIYDPATDEWDEGAPMRTPRGMSAIGVVGKKIYAIGGVVEIIGGRGMMIAEVYDTTTDSWSRLPGDLGESRLAHAVSVVDGVIYSIGGVQQLGGQPVLAVESYDTGVGPRAVSPRGKSHTSWGDLKTR
jgi:RNA polymerase sigma factor (sigma-70 family)